MFFIKNKNLSPSKIDYSWFIGIHISSSMRKLEASLIGASGSGIDASIILKKSVSFDLPVEITSAFDELNLELRRSERDELGRSNGFSERFNSRESNSIPSKEFERDTIKSSLSYSSSNLSILNRLVCLRAMVASIQEEAIAEALDNSDVKQEDIVAVVVNEPGIWVGMKEWEQKQAYYSLGDATYLAERTGFNIVDSFVSKVFATSNPSFLSFPYWILLGNSDQDKLLIDLGETARWTYLPSAKNDSKSWKNIVFNEVCPCGALLNSLTQQATKGDSLIDVGGKLCVQGRRSSDLIEHWRSKIQNFSKEENFWSQYVKNPGLKTVNANFYLDCLQELTPKKSYLDALCTAVHSVVEQIGESVEASSCKFAERYDVVVMGAAKQNGLLFNKLSSVLSPRPLHSITEYGCFLEDSFDATAVAVLGLLLISELPTALVVQENETDVCIRQSMLGKLTPGTIDSWKRLRQFQCSY